MAEEETVTIDTLTHVDLGATLAASGTSQFVAPAALGTVFTACDGLAPLTTNTTATQDQE